MASIIRFLVFFLLNLGFVCSDYLLLVRSHSYTNPTSRCVECRGGCCDRFIETICSVNTRYLCDTFFTYCLQPIGSNSLCSPQITTDTIWDGQPIDFSPSVVLGVQNPLPLLGISIGWEGVELYIRAMDDDNDNPGDLPNDLIDDFIITIPNDTSYIIIGNETVPKHFTSSESLAEIVLSFEVVCAPDFVGELCEVAIDDCIGPLSNCSGNGLCVDGVETFTCDCQSGFTGQYCEINIDECLDINCTGNGVCVDGVNSFTCVCDPGFTGILCQIDIDDCDNISCNSGRCQDRVNGFICDCDAGFEGLLCTTDIDECIKLNVNCSGQGRCIDGVNSFTCACEAGYTGQLCEVNIDDCVEVNCTGNRYCVDGVNSYECICNHDYIGADCNIRISYSTTLVTAGPVGAFLVLLLLMLCVMAMAFVTFKQCHKKRKKRTYIAGLNRRPLETSAPFIQNGNYHRRQSNIYDSIVHNGNVVSHDTELEDPVIYYWNENYHAPPLQPSSLKKSISKQSSDDVEDSMCYNPLYDGSTVTVSQSASYEEITDVGIEVIRTETNKAYNAMTKKSRQSDYDDRHIYESIQR